MKNKVAGKRTVSPSGEFFKNCLWASVLALVLAATLFAVCSVVITKASIPFGVHQTMTTVVVALAMLASCFMIGIKIRQNGLLLGLLSGVITFLVILILSFVLGNKSVSGQFLIKLLAMASAGGLGGLWGVNRAAKTKKIRV